jgi:hypothetical protein
VTKIEMIFLQQWRVGVEWSEEGGRGEDSLLRFRLERGGDEMKRCKKMKWRQ